MAPVQPLEEIGAGAPVGQGGCCGSGSLDGRSPRIAAD